jgi:hypothetical protein
VSRDDGLVEIRIVDMDLDDYRHSQAHHDELFREFTLIASSTDDDTIVPKRLLALIDEVTGQFSGFTAGPNEALADAAARGDSRIDLVFELPPSARDAVVRLKQLLADADEYCRSGDLLTLAPSDDAIAFRDWYLDEFARQIDGEPPRPWPEVRGSAG